MERQGGKSTADTGILGIPPLHFVHILNLNTNITHLEEGPKTVVLKSHEQLVLGPLPHIIVPPGHYCCVKNPARKYVKGQPVELRIGFKKIHFHKEPFPLIPGEELQDAAAYMQGPAPDAKKQGVPPSVYQAMKKLPVVGPNCALRLKALLDFDDEGVARKAGEYWHVEGPVTYYPVPAVKIENMVQPVIIRTGEVLRLRALQDLVDRDGSERVTGEEWLVTRPGAYLGGAYEEVVGVEPVVTLTENKGLHLRATQSVTDNNGVERMTGEEWLVTGEDMETYEPTIGVKVLREVDRLVLGASMYCVIRDQVDDDGKPQLGQRLLRKGVDTFFLHPGESLETGIQKAYCLERDEAIVVEAREALHLSLKDIVDSELTEAGVRQPGDRWMINGPTEFIPSIEVEVVDKRKAIPFSKNEGIYVQHTKTGEVRVLEGPQSYLLETFEKLWEKKLSDLEEELLKHGGGMGSGDIRKVAYFEQSIDPAILNGRDKTRMVTYRCPGNAAVQVNNYQKKTARVVFGPDLVVLGPHENFNVLSLSAGKPKRSNALKSLCLMLGPDFITDILVVETSDHARLSVQISLNNYFEFTRGDSASESKLFAVPDFTGYACRQIGARIRGLVAQTTFDEFHKHSVSIIRTAVFGLDTEGAIRSTFKFGTNNLVITNVDVQSIEPVDTKMRDSLMRSVQMAIEIATNSIEAAARHEANRKAQIARGHLERQVLENEKQSEEERTKLAELQAVTAAVESTGQATAEASAHAEKVLIECHSQIEAARLEAEAKTIEHDSELDSQIMLRDAEIAYLAEQNRLEIYKEKEMAKIEVTKFAEVTSAIGRDTIVSIATAGPAAQCKLLASLGLQSTLITDGNSPINLFNTAHGMVAQPGAQ